MSVCTLGRISRARTTQDGTDATSPKSYTYTGQKCISHTGILMNCLKIPRLDCLDCIYNVRIFDSSSGSITAASRQDIQVLWRGIILKGPILRHLQATGLLSGARDKNQMKYRYEVE